MANAWADELYELFAARLNELIVGQQLPDNQQFVVALGGGADSQTVLDLIDRYRQQHPSYQYFAVHLDHSFHPSSAVWAQQIEADMVARQMPHCVELLEVPVGNRESKEAQGREQRYRRLSELTAENAIILVGQHRNDQIETFLLQLKRGSGPKGLSAMAVLAPFTGQRQLWRPLLDISKADIYRYAHQRELFWIEDETNTDTAIERNFLRHDVIPVLESRWPEFGRSVTRSAALCAEQQALLDELLSGHLSKRVNADGELDIHELEHSSEAFQRALLRGWLAQQQTRMPSQAQLEQLRRQMLHTTNDAEPKVSWGTYCVTRFTDRQTRHRWLQIAHQ